MPGHEDSLRLVTEIRAKADKDLEAALAGQASVVAELKSDKVNLAEIGQRLELAPTEVCVLLKLSCSDSDADRASDGDTDSATDRPTNDDPVTLELSTEGEKELASAS